MRYRALIYLMTIQFWQMDERREVTCGCETCISANSLHEAMLIQWKKWIYPKCEWNRVQTYTQAINNIHSILHAHKQYEWPRTQISEGKRYCKWNHLSQSWLRYLFYFIGNVHAVVYKSAHRLIWLMKRQARLHFYHTTSTMFIITEPGVVCMVCFH